MKKFLIIIGLLVTQLMGIVAQTDKTSNATEQNKWPKYSKGGPYATKNSIRNDSIIRENTFNNSTIVFEGVRRYYCAFYGKYHNIAYYITDVKKVFKGKMNNKTIKVLFSMGPNEVPYCGNVEHGSDSIAIFFCKDNSKLKSELPVESDNGDTLIIDGYNEKLAQHANMIYVNDHPHGIGMSFGNKANVYTYLRTRKGLNVPPYVEPQRVLPPPEPGSIRMTKAQFDSLSFEIEKQEKEKAQQNLKH
jgi:hypothetical protein